MDQQSRTAQVSAMVISSGPELIEKELRGSSQKKEVGDPFFKMYGFGTDNLIEPPYQKDMLAELIEYNPVLGPCIDAMKTNVDGTGHDFIPRKLDKDIDANMEKEKKAELHRLQRLFKYCHPVLSFIQLRRRFRHDFESTAEAYFEVIRNGKGDICGFEHLESPTMRMTRIDDEPTIIKMRILNEETLEYEDEDVPYRFRRFAQKVGQTTTWYKEFGDPRNVSSKTGNYVKGEKNLANEVIFVKKYSPRTPCGVPRYIGALLSIYGSRKSEELNFNYLKNGKHIPLAILIEGGMLTKTSEKTIREYIKKRGRGVENAHNILVLEAAPAESDDLNKSPGRVGIKFEKLVDVLQKDELFQDYIENNGKRVRMAWRLPPLFLGLADDYTRATAKESLMYADPQIFAPERKDFDFLINRLILTDMGIRFWTFKSNSPEVTDSNELSQAASRLERSGGITPRAAAQIASKILDYTVDLKGMPEEWLDKPMTAIIEEIRARRGQVEPPAEGKKTEKTRRDAIVDFVKGLSEVREYLQKETSAS